MAEVMGGQVQLMIDTVAATRGQIEAGKLKALGITTLKPSSVLPGVKPIAEQGVTGFEMTGWNALYAPRDTPQRIVTQLSEELAKILALPETTTAPAAARARGRRRHARRSRAVREGGARQMGAADQGDRRQRRLTPAL